LKHCRVNPPHALRGGSPVIPRKRVPGFGRRDAIGHHSRIRGNDGPSNKPGAIEPPIYEPDDYAA
jgi:hypothetical protein